MVRGQGLGGEGVRVPRPQSALGVDGASQPGAGKDSVKGKPGSGHLPSSILSQPFLLVLKNVLRGKLMC